MFKKLISLLLVAMFITVLASCNKNEPVNGETEITEENSSVLSTDESLSVSDTTVTDTTVETSETTKAIEITAPSSIPTTKAEIVACYNNAANWLKTAKPGATGVREVQMDALASDKKAANFVIDLAWKLKIIEESVPFDVAKGESHDDAIEARERPWASKLTADDIKEASCVENGDYYELKLVIIDEFSAETPENYEDRANGRAFKIVTSEIVEQLLKKSGNVIKVENVTMDFKGSYIECKVNKNTGEFVSGKTVLQNDLVVYSNLATFTCEDMVIANTVEVKQP